MPLPSRKKVKKIATLASSNITISILGTVQ
jgi:hypothetical protein